MGQLRGGVIAANRTRLPTVISGKSNSVLNTAKADAEYRRGVMEEEVENLPEVLAGDWIDEMQGDDLGE